MTVKENWVDGDILTAGSFNFNWSHAWRIAGSTTENAAVTGSEAFILGGSVAVASGVKDFAKIDVTISVGGPPGASTNQQTVDFRISGQAAETSIGSVRFATIAAGETVQIPTVFHSEWTEPSQDDKDNGFSINVYFKSTSNINMTLEKMVVYRS